MFEAESASLEALEDCEHLASFLLHFYVFSLLDRAWDIGNNKWPLIDLGVAPGTLSAWIGIMTI